MLTVFTMLMQCKMIEGDCVGSPVNKFSSEKIGEQNIPSLSEALWTIQDQRIIDLYHLLD